MHHLTINHKTAYLSPKLPTSTQCIDGLKDDKFFYKTISCEQRYKTTVNYYKKVLMQILYNRDIDVIWDKLIAILQTTEK